MNVKKDILWRVYLSFFFVLLMGALILFQVGKIQFGNGGYWRKLADSNTTAFISIEPIRGNIYAADGSLMAASLPIYEIRLDLNADALTNDVFYSKIDSLAYRLSNYFKDKSAYQYKRLLIQKRKEGARYYRLKRNINHNQLKDIKQFPLFRKGRFKGGFIVEQKSKRIKPFGQLAGRTIGYKVKNVIGVGLEGAFNEYLAGRGGKRLMQKVAGGAWIPLNTQNELEPEDGKDVFTTIDMNIQDFTEQALQRALTQHKAAHGCAVVMEVKTGHVKAIANLEQNENGTYTENYNYAVGESLEPGSTFKLASALVLLEKGLIKPKDIIDTDDGELEFYDRVMRDAKDGGYGKITFERAMEISSNVAFSKLIHEKFSKDPQEFIDALKEIGLNEPLGLQIAGEGMPVIKEPTDKDWSGTTLPWMSIGYETRFTPLQLLSFYNAIANDGKLIKPQFATEVREIGKTVERFDPKVINNKVCSEKTLKQLKKMLVGVVNNGTAENLKTADYQIAGKTGTAQIAMEGGYASDEKTFYQASFAGFFPADDPKYSCIVVINRPSKGVYYGSWVAGPVFREIADQIYANSTYASPVIVNTENNSNELVAFKAGHISDARNIYKEFGINYRSDETIIDWLKTNDTKIKNLDLDQEKVPDLRGMTLSDATYLAEQLGLNVGSYGYGRVIKQEPNAGTDLNKTSNLILQLQ